MEARKDELDRWVDEALVEYTAPDPRPGLELRTLAYVRAHQQTRRFGIWRRWTLAAAAVTAVAIALHTYWPAPRRIQPIAQRTPLRNPAPASAQTGSTAQVKMPVATKRKMQTARIAVAASEPRLETFPSPLPLTPGERTLLGLVRQSPSALTEVARAQEFEPIVIPEIKIPALEPIDRNSPGEKK